MKNQNSSGRGARKPSGFRDGKPSASKSRKNDKPRSSGEYKGRGDRQEGSGAQWKSTDWSTGGYRITKKGAGIGKSKFKGFIPEDELVSRGPNRDYGKPGNKGSRYADNKSSRGQGRAYDNQRAKDEAYKSKQVQLDNEIAEEVDRESRVEGRNPVLEALRSGRPLNKLYVEKGNDDPSLLRIAAMAREKNVPIQYLERYKLDTMSQTRIHQGVILEVAAQEYVEVEDILESAKEKNETPFILVLDGITDTNNLGSIIRSAECAGVHGIILPKRRSATLNATVAKVAAGALEYVPVARVTNLVQTLRDLKSEGIWIIGADMDGESNYYDADLTGPCALVIGSEGEGLGRLVKDECDMMVRIPMKGQISSLNAGVAAALIMFEITKQRELK